MFGERALNPTRRVLQNKIEERAEKSDKEVLYILKCGRNKKYQ